MKTTFKKSVLAFLTCVLALAFALTGCSGGGKDPKANFVGSWELSGGTLEGEELTDEYMKMLEDWGVHCVLILDEDGTGALDLFLEVVDLKWEAKDATTATITAEGESQDMKLEDGKLVLKMDDDKLIFTKSDKDLSGTVKKDREAAEKEEDPKAWAKYYHDVVFAFFDTVRKPADELEKIVDAKAWPFPTYEELLFEQ